MQSQDLDAIAVFFQITITNDGLPMKNTRHNQIFRIQRYSVFLFVLHDVYRLKRLQIVQVISLFVLFFFLCFVCNKRLILGYYTYRLGFADRASTISKQKIMFFSKIVIRLRRKWKKKKTYNIKQSWSILVFLYPDRFLER